MQQADNNGSSDHIVESELSTTGNSPRNSSRVFNRIRHRTHEVESLTSGDLQSVKCDNDDIFFQKMKAEYPEILSAYENLMHENERLKEQLQHVTQDYSNLSDQYCQLEYELKQSKMQLSTLLETDFPERNEPLSIRRADSQHSSYQDTQSQHLQHQFSLESQKELNMLQEENESIKQELEEQLRIQATQAEQMTKARKDLSAAQLELSLKCLESEKNVAEMKSIQEKVKMLQLEIERLAAQLKQVEKEREQAVMKCQRFKEKRNEQCQLAMQLRDRLDECSARVSSLQEEQIDLMQRLQHVTTSKCATTTSKMDRQTDDINTSDHGDMEDVEMDDSVSVTQVSDLAQEMTDSMPAFTALQNGFSDAPRQTMHRARYGHIGSRSGTRIHPTSRRGIQVFFRCPSPNSEPTSETTYISKTPHESYFDDDSISMLTEGCVRKMYMERNNLKRTTHVKQMIGSHTLEVWKRLATPSVTSALFEKAPDSVQTRLMWLDSVSASHASDEAQGTQSPSSVDGIQSWPNDDDFGSGINTPVATLNPTNTWRFSGLHNMSGERKSKPKEYCEMSSTSSESSSSMSASHANNKGIVTGLLNLASGLLPSSWRPSGYFTGPLDKTLEGSV